MQCLFLPYKKVDYETNCFSFTPNIISKRIKKTVAGQLTEDLRRIADWCCANSLLVNPDKTKLLLLGTRQMLRKIPDAIHVTLLGKQIYPVSSAKDLGIRNYNRCKSELW